MKNKIVFLIGFIFGMAPIYPVFWWWKICFEFSELKHLELVSKYNETILFGLDSSIMSHLIIIFSGAISVLCFSLLLYWKNKDEVRIDKLIKIVILFMLIIVSIFTFFNVWSIL